MLIEMLTVGHLQWLLNLMHFLWTCTLSEVCEDLLLFVFLLKLWELSLLKLKMYENFAWAYWDLKAKWTGYSRTEGLGGM